RRDRGTVHPPRLAYSEQQLHGELIEPLVRVPARAQRREVELGVAQLAEGDTGALASVGLSQQLLDLGICVEARDLVLENEIGPHAAGGEVPDARFIFCPVSVTIEVAHPRPLRVLEQLDE